MLGGDEGIYATAGQSLGGNSVSQFVGVFLAEALPGTDVQPVKPSLVSILCQRARDFVQRPLPMQLPAKARSGSTPVAPRHP